MIFFLFSFKNITFFHGVVIYEVLARKRHMHDEGAFELRGSWVPNSFCVQVINLFEVRLHGRVNGNRQLMVEDPTLFTGRRGRQTRQR